MQATTIFLESTMVIQISPTFHQSYRKGELPDAVSLHRLLDESKSRDGLPFMEGLPRLFDPSYQRDGLLY